VFRNLQLGTHFPQRLRGGKYARSSSRILLYPCSSVFIRGLYPVAVIRVRGVYPWPSPLSISAQRPHVQ